MIRRIMVLLCCLISCFSFDIALANCGQAPATNDPSFCQSFTEIAYCHCMEKIGDPNVCGDMNQVYDDMLGFYGSLQDACGAQENDDDGVAKLVCIDDWNYYRNGCGKLQGDLCNSTGRAC